MALKPPVEVPQGAIRLNTDSQKLEFFAQDQWWQMATESSSPLGGGRGACFGGAGATAPYPESDVIDYVTIATQGNAVDFGNLTTATKSGMACGSATRGFYFGGITPSYVDTIEYITWGSTGNATDFGNLTEAVRIGAGANNSTRALRIGGGTAAAAKNTIDYWTMTSSGNAVDFGDLAMGGSQYCEGTSNPILAVGHKWNDAAGRLDYVTIATTGNAQEFGGLMPRHDTGAMTGSTAIRGFFAGGYSPGAPEAGRNDISYFLWASRGSNTGFGELSAHRWDTQGGSAASPTRIVWMGNGAGANTGGEDHIDYINPNTEGDAVDFGDLSVERWSAPTSSNTNGGTL